MKATVLYYSHKGKTAGYARQIAMYLWSKGLDVSLRSISDVEKSQLEGTDFLLLGCWTSGWFVIGQHPHSRWTEFARTLRGAVPEKTLFFTTYKIRTGSMFRRMKEALGLSGATPAIRMQSRTGVLTDADKGLLDDFIGMKQ